MARILVAEDSPTQAEEIRLLLSEKGYDVQLCRNGAEALQVVEVDPPHVVLTDLDMPVMDGLELVEEIRSRFPQVPVVLMTAYGSEETAMKALQRGAASYVPKKFLLRDLVDTLEGIVTVAQQQHDQARLASFMEASDSRFCLENNPALVMPVVAFVQDAMESVDLVDEGERIRVGVALEEAILNAMYRGNLELTSDQLRDAWQLEDGGQSYYDLLETRRQSPRFRDRRVHVAAAVSRAEARCTVRGDGAAFQPSMTPSPNDSAVLDGDRDRGLMLINTFMDEVTFDTGGNEITMVKRRGR
jgi:CheY-like chemotaxis protein